MGKLGTERAFRCKWCSRKAYVRQGRIWLCKKHYRFSQMRTCAKRHNKYVPTYEELELLTINTLQIDKGKVCPECNRVMNWVKKDGSSTVVTLQHDRSGNIKLLCQSCNSRHSKYDGDSFYTRNKSKKLCPKCKDEKELSDFFNVKSSSKRWLNKGSYCKDCNRKYQKEYAREYRKRQRNAV